MNRRSFIKLGAVLAAMPTQIVLAAKNFMRNDFKVPSLELGKREGKNVYFDLNIQVGKSSILPNKTTQTLGINQIFLGTTLRASKGDRVYFRVKNNINKPATLHWHGMKLPAKADGGPHQEIKPNNTWHTDFEIIQPAATLWYHSHQMHKTGEQVYQGLAGMFIIDDKESQKLGLPNEYGVDDVPVIIQDRDFNSDGSFRYMRGMRDRMMGKRGNTILVNGVVTPILKAQRSLLRLRLLNGSNARTYHLKFNDNRNFHIIGSDGGLLEKSHKVKSVRLSPAERVEILLEVAAAEKPILQHQNARYSDGMMASSGSFDIMQIDASGIKPSVGVIPKKLVEHQLIDKNKVDKVRQMNLQMKMGPMAMFGNAFSINGKAMDKNRIDEVVQAGSVEVWQIRNASMMAHPFHIHNVQFKIISRSGVIKDHELGFKDVVLVHSNEVVEVIMQFPDFKDKNIPYMYHCHILEHEDGGMMGQFVVV
jgi:bilirubin oxidase